MTNHEKAIAYCWQMANREKVNASALRWYYAHKFACDCASYRYYMAHYQERLEYFREYHRRKNDGKRKGDYRARIGGRVPEYVTCIAHARALTNDVTPINPKKVAAVMK